MENTVILSLKIEYEEKKNKGKKESTNKQRPAAL